MGTNIQVRAVDPELAAAAKRRAAETEQSVSAYIRALIERDVREQERVASNRALMAEIESDPRQPMVSREAARAALRESRRELSCDE